MPDLIYKLGEYITANPRDFINICFWIFTGLLAFVTYKNAKKTLFNPIRSEMVKYQMKVITEFIDNHTSKGFDFDNAIDYSNLFKLNYETDYLLDILANETNLENHQFDELYNKRLEYCQQNLGGLFEIRKKQDKLYLELVYGNFDIVKQYVQTKYIKDKEQNNQDLFLQRFYLSTRFFNFYADLLNLQTNPFIPEKIKNTVNTLISNIYKNITVLYELLSMHILNQTEDTYHNIYSQFHDRKIDHQQDLEELRNKISVYFKVNNI